MKKYQLEEVFTPSQPAFNTYVERDGVNKQLKRAIKTPGKQIIIYGHTGAGKTTILRNLIKELKLNTITTRCMKGMSLSSIVIDAFNQLNVYYDSAGESTDGGKASAKFGGNYFVLKASLNIEDQESVKTTSKRAVELPITPQTLADYIGQAKCCWIIEDFHKIDDKEKAQMAQIMKVFMDSSVTYSSLKVIALGAVNTAREVVQYDPEMKNRVSEIYVPLMSEGELKRIIEEGTRLLKVAFDPDIVDKIATYSSGLAAVTHQLSLLICETEGVSETQRNQKSIPKAALNSAIDEYVNEYSDTLKSTYDNATKAKNQRTYESPKDILNAILTYNKESVAAHEVIAAIKKVHEGYKGNNLKKYLDELTTTDRGEILRYDKDSYTYHFSNPFLRAYAQFVKKSDHTHAPASKAEFILDLTLILKRELEIARQAFKEDYLSEDFPEI